MRPKHILDADFLKGGPGSGNFGHAGRPGQRGGSAKDGAPAKPSKERIKKPQEIITVLSEESWETLPKLRPLADAAFSKLSTEHKDAIRHYTQNGYIRLNEWMRGEIKVGHDVAPDLAEYLEGQAETITQAIEKAGSLPEPKTVWRGIKVDGQKDVRALAEKFHSQIGGTVNLHGFQSTSVDQTQALKFAGDESRSQLVFRINTPKGLPVSDKTGNGSGDEGEILLGHNWKYRVKDVKMVTFRQTNTVGDVEKYNRILVDLQVED